MMISPDAYIDLYVDSSYEELIAERDRLIARIRDYEEKEKRGDRSGNEWLIEPSADVVYQCYLEYLAKLSMFMCDKYNKEYVWGEKSLASDSDDASPEKALSDDQLAKIRKRAEDATPGPWKAYIEDRDFESGSSFIKTAADDIELSGATEADYDFIANARQDIPILLDEIERLRK